MHTRSLLTLLFLSIGVSLFAQQNSGVVGTVSDVTGGRIEGARIEATNQDTGLARVATTGISGDYSIPDLPVGSYRLVVAKEGFKGGLAQDVKLDVQRTMRVDFNLQIGAVTAQMTVSTEAPLLQTTESEVSTLIDNQQILSLPLNGRNYLQLNFLVPGTAPGSSNANYIFGTHGESAEAFSVNGVRSLYNAYLIDGVPTEEVADGAPSFEPSIDAIEEFRSETSNSSAQFGSMAGGQINLVTKTGTNSLHGSAYEFLRNDAFDALPYNFSNSAESKSPLKRHNFGASMGGAIWKKHTFFFGSYEALRLTQGGPTLGLVPTQQQRQGDLSLLPDGTPNPFQLSNPNTGQPYPNDQVPVGSIAAKFLNDFVPLPNISFDPSINANYFVNSPNQITHNSYSARIDHSISANNLIFGRWLYENVDNRSAKIFPTDAFAITSTGQNWALGYTRLMGANKVNDLRIGYNRFWQNEGNGRSGKTNVLADLGMQGLCDAPECWGEPEFDVFGFIGFGEHGAGQPYSSPRYWSDEIIDLSDTFTYTKGSHTLQAGITLDDYHDSFNEAIVPRGIYGFDGHFTAPDQQAHSETSFADFLIGDPQNIVASINPFTPYWVYHGINPWIQDSWRVTPTLTLNLGFRYEHLGRPVARRNNFSNIDFSTTPPQLVTPDTAAQHNFPSALVNSTNKDFAPRLGFAWAPLGRFVLRGAYGIFYGRDLIGTWTDASINPPFVSQFVYIPTPTDITNFSLSSPLANAPASAVLYDAIARDTREAMFQQWNLSTQYQLSKASQLTVSYVGNKGSHLTRQYDINQAFPGSITPNVVGNRPYAGFGPIMYTESEAFSNYNSLQVQAEHRYSSGFSLLAAYTYAKCIDDSPGSDYGEGGVAYINIRNWRQMKGLCNQDMNQRFSLSYIYDLPFGRGKRFGADTNRVISSFISNWQVTGIVTWTGGQPYTIVIDQDRANSGDSGGAASTPNRETPNIIADPNLSSSQRSRFQYFNTQAFAYPNWGSYGDGSRNSMIGPGLVTFDMGIARSFVVWRESKLEFRAEGFNVFNHANFSNPDATLGSPTFGQLLGAGTMREIQLALKLTF